MVKVDDWNPTPDATATATSSSSSGGTAAATLGAGGAANIVQAVDDSIADNPDVLAYTVNGRTVQRRSLSELLEARRYFQNEAARSRGIKQTLARFD